MPQMPNEQSNRAVRPPITGPRLLSLLGPPLAIMALIFYFSAQANFVPTQGFWETLIRKLFHVSEYLALTLAWWRALHGLTPGAGRRLQLAGASAIAFLYAISDEFHQSFVAGRHGSARDVAIDSIGIGLALLVVLWLYARRRRVGPSRPNAA